MATVSVFAPSEGAAGPLDAVLRLAGAVFSSRNGHPVAIHYGSAAGELSVCVSAVGLVDRSDLCKLEIETPGDRASTELSSRVAGAEPRTSTPAVTPASASTTVQPVGRSVNV